MKTTKNFREEFRMDLFETIKNSRILKGLKIVIIIAGGIYVLGFGCKILNFSLKHYSDLKSTIKQ